MTGDDLRAVPEWVDWRGRPPKVTIPAATRDALADVLDAAEDAVRFEHSPSHMAALADALDALDADR